MTTYTYLILIRHGESLWNKENRFTGWTDIDLSEHGLIEAQKAGNTLKKETAINVYKNVHTGPKSQPGGDQEGLANSRYQS